MCGSPQYAKKVKIPKLFLVSSTIFIADVYFLAQYKHVANIKGPLVKSNDFAILSNCIWHLSDNCLIARFWYIDNSEHLKNWALSSGKVLHVSEKWFK